MSRVITTFPILTLPQAQQLYDHFQTVREVATLIGVSHSPTHQWLLRLGVELKHRGGNYGRTWTQRSEHYAANRVNGDLSLKARPVKRMLCSERRKDGAGNVLQCVETLDGLCGLCERGELHASLLVAGIRGGSLAPAQAMGW
jgi:hypothetical protein